MSFTQAEWGLIADELGRASARLRREGLRPGTPPWRRQECEEAADRRWELRGRVILAKQEARELDSAQAGTSAV